MLLDTFTKEELISALQDAFKVFEPRICRFAENNVTMLARKAKGNGFQRIFSAEIKNQRYYLVINYERERDEIKIGVSGMITFIANDKRTLVVIFNPLAEPDAKSGAYLKMTTEHFINRFCERQNIDTKGKALHEKVLYFTNSIGKSFTGIPMGDFIKRNGKPALKAGFLDASDAKMWLSCNANGDVAIIEQYGNIPVWRTYISEEMLFEKQKSDPYYQALVEVIRRDEEAKNHPGTI